MAARRGRRKQSVGLSADGAGTAIVAIGLIALLANYGATIGTFILWAFVIAVAAWLFKRHREKMAHAKFLDHLEASVETHENALISYYHQSRSEDLFGNVDEARWYDKIDVFLRNQVVSENTDFASWRKGPVGRNAAQRVNDVTVQKVAQQREVNPLAHVDAASLTPIEYERHCAELLKEMGWAIRMTPATRDGGADFIAEKSEWRMVVQCKRYAQPVGNKAVQEVTSAVRLYNGNIACVVAPTGFTRQAQQEANGLSVHLLHHSALPAFAEKLAA